MTALGELIRTDRMLDQQDVRHGVTAYMAALREAFQHRVRTERAARAERLGDKPLGRADVADLIKGAAGLRDNLTYAAAELRRMAKDIDVVIGDEVAATQRGQQALSEGRTATVVVPDGMGQEVVASIRTPRTRKVAASQLLTALRSIRTRQYGDGHFRVSEEPGETLSAAAFRLGYSNGQQDMVSLGKWEPQVTKVDALARTLLSLGDNDAASLLDECVVAEDGDQIIDVKVEDPKRRRRT